MYVCISIQIILTLSSLVYVLAASPEFRFPFVFHLIVAIACVDELRVRAAHYRCIGWTVEDFDTRATHELS